MLLVAVSVAALLAASACGGGEGSGGGGGGDLAQEAAEIDQLLTRLEGLPESATTAEQFARELRQIRDRVQEKVQTAADAEAPEGLESERDKLANRLRSLRTSLNRVQGLVDGGDLESAKNAIPRLLLIAQIRSTIETIQAGSAG